MSRGSPITQLHALAGNATASRARTSTSRTQSLDRDIDLLEPISPRFVPRSGNILAPRPADIQPGLEPAADARLVAQARRLLPRFDALHLPGELIEILY